MIENDESRPLLIREMDASERPREKALKQGFDALTDAEIMAMIFATGIKGKNVVELCHDILEDNMNHLSLVMKKSVKQLCAEYKGVGQVKALTLLASLELGRRAAYDAQRLAEGTPITSSTDAYNRIKHRFLWLDHEEFWISYLNRAGHIVREECLSKGGTWATVVDVKLAMRSALDCLASSIILYHNHPSGQLRPSGEDDNITRKISDAAKLFEMRVADHLIVTNSGFYSYLDHGRL